MATIMDVAKMANVSRSTVSLVLNNSPLVKNETRQKVEEVIRQIDYVPNNSARSLPSKVMYSLGIIIMVQDLPYDTYGFNIETGLFSHDVTTGISNGLAGTQYALNIERFCFETSGGDLPNLLKNRRIDGAFIVGGLYEPSFIDMLLTRNIPFVVVGGHRETKVDSVSPDPEKGAYMAAQHLVETGHKRILLVNAPKFYRSSDQRRNAIETIKKESSKRISWEIVYCPHNSGEGGYLAVKDFYENGGRCDGIIAANTMMAMGVIRYFYEKKIYIPDDVSLVAYEDNIMGGYASPAMTAINVQKEYMGETAAHLLLERLKNPGKEISSIIAEPFFVYRNSVKDKRKKRHD
ncbi:LacI family transcriptional regulator [Treponema sp. OttesenSCG-928-L16]|nr:LacI family transcriptional regulator [Treponema sp. OttesenSCG-928-L16]